MNRWPTILFWALVLFWPVSALGQAPIVVDVTTGVQFLASPDHDSTVNILADYTADVRNTAGATVLTLALGKPTPDPANTILVKPMWTPVQFAALPPGQYTAVVKANGPGGSNASAPSLPFVRPGIPGAPGQPIIVR